MGDIFVAGLTLVAGSVALFSLGFWTITRCPRVVTILLGLLAAALTVWFAVAWHGSLRLTHLLACSAVVVLGNWIPLGAGFLSGMVLGDGGTRYWRRLAMVLVLLSLGWGSVFATIPAAVPLSQDVWAPTRECLQSVPSSCSACCAVTLLRHHGIVSDEQEMMELCLTSFGGTPSLGLYRGLKLKTDRSPWEVALVEPRIEALRAKGPRPVIVLLRAEGAPAFLQQFSSGWAPAASGHAVVVYGITADGRRAIVGDPACGRSLWNIDTLMSRWRGPALRLIPRNPPQA